MPGAIDLAREGIVTGASARNWAGYEAAVSLPEGFAADKRALLTDPQTSGGLLVVCAPDAVERVLDIFHRDGFAQTATIGEIVAGPASIRVD